MRFQASVTTVSWIPSESVPGMGKMVFASGVGHYDDPPPDTLGDLEALRRADRFRFAHHLAGWIEVTDDRVVHVGYQPDSGLTMGSTLLWVLGRGVSFPAVAFPILRRKPEITDTSARFVQTVGGHTVVPIPRRLAPRRSSSCRRLSSGPHWRSPSTPMAVRSLSWWGRARFRATGCMTPKGDWPPRPGSPITRSGRCMPFHGIRRGVMRTHRRC